MQALTLTTLQLKAALQATEGEDVPERTLAWWAANGIVTPSVRQSKGIGIESVTNGHIFNLADLAKARLVVQLRRGGISLQRIRLILSFLERREFRDVLKPTTRAKLVVHGRQVFVIRPGEPDVEAPSGQIRLQLSAVWKGTQEAAHAAKRAA